MLKRERDVRAFLYLVTCTIAMTMLFMKYIDLQQHKESIASTSYLERFKQIIRGTVATAPSRPQLIGYERAVPRNYSFGCEYTDKIALVIYTTSDHSLYTKSISTMQCYASRMNYSLIWLKHDQLDQHPNCSIFSMLLFRKHCVVASMMKQTPQVDWFFVLDADTGVANPDHCLDEYIDDRVDLIFYERFYNWEIAAGNYAAKNTHYARLRSFLMHWANMEKLGPHGGAKTDQMYIQGLLLNITYPDNKTIVNQCNELWFKPSGGQYYPHVYCVNKYLDKRRLTKNLRLIHRAHAWAIDSHIIMDHWGQAIFMHHGWKTRGQTSRGWALRGLPTGDQCSPVVRATWPFNNAKHKDENGLKAVLNGKDIERQGAHKVMLGTGTIRHCWPRCEDPNNYNLTAIQ